ncbi:MAG: hypothetical protein IT495_16215 [Gammaproteobacteria bacterium]|nr:hypothetical protein [Gammaproteobacteria bacterium]
MSGATAKPPAADDPMLLVGVAMPAGDPELMAECLVEEFLMLGYDKTQLLGLFQQPRFGATHSIYLGQGEARIRALIDRVCGRYAMAAIDDGRDTHE